MKKTVALYPGTFDPLTNGHLDIIDRAINIFDKLIVVVANNSRKANNLFSIEERKRHLQITYQNTPQVEVHIIQGLLVNAFTRFKASVIIRGLRTISDFEYESAMEAMNKTLNSQCETIFFMPNAKTTFVSSNIIKEIVSNKGDISKFVTSDRIFLPSKEILISNQFENFSNSIL